MPNYSELQSAPVRLTIDALKARIQERFPGSGLARVGAELLSVADRNQSVIERLQKPLWPIRALTTITIIALVALVLWAVLQLAGRTTGDIGGVSDLLQAVDSATNQLLLLSLALIFLVSLETRMKRRSALRMLHRLRSIAHVVDMHQLTKDPDYAVRPITPTASSPLRTLSPHELGRYLDYCSELLALTSKLAALHAQHLQDPVVLDAVNDIESLTADLSRKIWQKLTILNKSQSHAPRTLALPDAPQAGLASSPLQGRSEQPSRVD